MKTTLKWKFQKGIGKWTSFYKNVAIIVESKHRYSFLMPAHFKGFKETTLTIPPEHFNTKVFDEVIQRLEHEVRDTSEAS